MYSSFGFPSPPLPPFLGSSFHASHLPQFSTPSFPALFFPSQFSPYTASLSLLLPYPTPLSFLSLPTSLLSPFLSSEILLPVAGVIKVETSLPAVKKLVNMLYTYSVEQAKRRHSSVSRREKGRRGGAE